MPGHEIVLDLLQPAIGGNGREYRASVVGAGAPDGHWNAWLEFVARDTQEVLRTGVETHQSTEHDLHHWARSLGDVYLRGALARATPSARETAAHRDAIGESHGASKAIAAAVDPFALFALGEHVLRRELQLFTRAVLRAIIIVHDLNPTGADLSAFTRAQLVAFITTAVEVHAIRRRRSA